MAAISLSLIPTNNTDADFRNWGKPISDALTDFGLIKTTDPQVDWATVLKPTVAGNYPASEVRKFNDSIGNTVPVVFKIEYGAGSGSTIPGLRLSFGTGSNGTGVITAPTSVSALTNMTVGSATSNTVGQTCKLSGDPSSFRLGMFLGSASGFYFCVGRTKNPSNSLSTTEAILISRTSGSSGLLNNYWDFVNPPQAEASGIFTPSVGGTGADGTTINYYPNLFFRGGTPIEDLNTIGAFNSDIGGTNPQTLTKLGASHVYYFLGGTATQLNTSARGGIVGTGIGMLFE